MTVLFAIDSFKGSCTSAEACAWAAEGFRRGWPGAETRCLPVADGGEGTVAAFRRLKFCFWTGPFSSFLSPILSAPLY